LKKAVIIGSALAGLLATVPAWALELHTGKEVYWRYELVDIVASLGVSETAAAYPAHLNATVWQDDDQVISVGNLKKVPLQKRFVD